MIDNLRTDLSQEIKETDDNLKQKIDTESN
jgi:hypothetical protein